MKKIPFIGWVMLIGTGVPATTVAWIAITSYHHDLGERIMVATGSIGWFLTIVGMCVYAHYQQKKGEEQLKQSSGK